MSHITRKNIHMKILFIHHSGALLPHSGAPRHHSGALRPHSEAPRHHSGAHEGDVGR
jgi:hypothetical protein